MAENPHPITRCVDAARRHGHAWAGGEIGRYLKPVLAIHDPEAVVRGWTYWLEKAVSNHGEDGRFMTPKAFSRAAKYWISMAQPVQTPHG